MLPTIHMFWHGSPLSRVERLSIASFVHHGHPVELHAYQEFANLPAGVTLRDAAAVLPFSAVYTHRRSGSLAPFADWFRYRLLAARGGIWADMDMVCLQALDYDDPVVMGWVNGREINNALLGLPAGDPLAECMALCCEQPNQWRSWDTLARRMRKLRRRLLYPHARERVRWSENGPRGLTLAARHLGGYIERALPEEDLYPVSFADWRSMFTPQAGGDPAWMTRSHAVHLWNNNLRREPGYDKNALFAPDTPYERLCQRYLPADAGANGLLWAESLGQGAARGGCVASALEAPAQR